VNTAIRTESSVLGIFIGLQCMDVLTTLVFLSRGVAEGNPLVSLALSTTHTPWIALAAAKMMAAFIGQYCYRTGRMALLRRANTGYALVVGWNLIAIGFTLFTR